MHTLDRAKIDALKRTLPTRFGPPKPMSGECRIVQAGPALTPVAEAVNRLVQSSRMEGIDGWGRQRGGFSALPRHARG